MVVVLGSINVDLVARVEHLPRDGETQRASGYDVHPGGKGANQALAARRAGAKVALVGAAGRDGHAATALALVDAAGVDVARVARVDGATGLALIHVDAQGRNAITIVPGANASVRAVMLADGEPAAGDVLLLQLEVPLDVVTAAARAAHARGASVVLNAAPPAALPDDLLHAVDVLVVNEHEAAVVARSSGLPAEPVAFCQAAADRWTLTAIVTLGAAGLVAADAVDVVRLPAPRVTVVDTTAAGDAFVGALAAALERRATLADALAEGVAAGSYACTQAGAQPSIGLRERWIDAARERRAAATVTRR